MDIKAEFLTGTVVSGEHVGEGQVKLLRKDIFDYLKQLGHVREHVAPVPVVEPPESAPVEPQPTKKGKK